MPNVSIIRRPDTIESVYYVDGVADGTIYCSLDPHGSPVIFELSTDQLTETIQCANADLFVGYGVYFENPVFEAGDTFTLFGQTFTCSATPGPGLFADYAAGYTFQQVAESMALAINQNSTLNKFLVAKAVNTNGAAWRIYIAAKFIGARYNIFPSNISYSATYPTWLGDGEFGNSFDVFRGQKLETYGYKVFIEIWATKECSTNDVRWNRNEYNLNAELIATLVQPYNPSNTFRFDIAQFLRPLTEPTLPSYQGEYTQFVLVDNAVRSYFIKVGEIFTGGYDPYTQEPDDVNNTHAQRYYCCESEMRWTAAGHFPAGIVPSPFRQYWAHSYDDASVINEGAGIDCVDAPYGVIVTDNISSTCAFGGAFPATYVHIGYASDTLGTGLSQTPGVGLDYIAAITTTSSVFPIASYFAGYWKKYVGTDGSLGPFELIFVHSFFT